MKTIETKVFCGLALGLAALLLVGCGDDFSSSDVVAGAGGMGAAGMAAAGMSGLGVGGTGGAPAYDGPLYVAPGGDGAIVRGFVGPLSDLNLGVEAQFAGSDLRLRVVGLAVPAGPGSVVETSHEVAVPIESVSIRAEGSIASSDIGHPFLGYQLEAATTVTFIVARNDSTGGLPRVPLSEIARLWVIRGNEPEHAADWP